MSLMTLALLLFGALFFGLLAERLQLPAVVGQIAAGIVLGPALLGWLQPTHAIHDWAELGLLLLMFLAGIESDLGLLTRYLKQSVTVALAGVVLPLAVFFALGETLAMNPEEAIFLAVLFSATSVSITAQILSDQQQLKTVAGATILGAAVLDDLIAVALWSLFQTTFRLSGQAQLPIFLALPLMALFLCVLLYGLHKLLPQTLAVLGRISLPGLTLGFVFGLVLLAAAGGELLGLSGAITAFLLGVLFSRQPQAASIEHGLTTIGQTIFVPIFFVNIGLKVTFAGQGKAIWLILLLTVAAILTKWLGAGLGAKMLGLQRSTANIVGVGMVSRGEMALVIADLGLSASVIGSTLYASLTFVILLTTIFTAIALQPMLKRRQA
ncbi:cation:proton antiporter [Leuconostocaceae bacterium ESL0958]|nr:cation:proton antiporter [Leuconostocaceae bacterium ESL0958]